MYSRQTCVTYLLYQLISAHIIPNEVDFESAQVYFAANEGTIELLHIKRDFIPVILPAMSEQQPRYSRFQILELVAHVFQKESNGIASNFTWTILHGTAIDIVPEILYPIHEFNLAQQDALALSTIQKSTDPQIVFDHYLDLLEESALDEETGRTPLIPPEKKQQVLEILLTVGAPAIILLCGRNPAENETDPRSSLLLFHVKYYSTQEALERVKLDLLGPETEATFV